MPERHRSLASRFLIPVLVTPMLLLAGGLASTAAAGVAPRADPAKAAIVFVGKVTHPLSTELYTMGPHGGNLHRLTHDGFADYDPVWSPDGTKIAWVRFPEVSCNCAPADIWVMNADGSDRHNLTNDGADIIGSPSWSPDGSQLVFTEGYRLYVIDADGTDQHAISVGPLDYDPVWSPDGTRIAFVGGGQGGPDIFAVDPDGSHRAHLTHTIGIAEYDPAWSPDGSKIAFTGHHGDNTWHVDAMRADGTGIHIVVDAYSLYPAWSPDGSKLLFYACDADCGLYRIRIHGGGFAPLGRQRDLAGFEPDYRDGIPG
jgi:Tol biopolymer transport system component